MIQWSGRNSMVAYVLVAMAERIRRIVYKKE